MREVNTFLHGLGMIPFTPSYMCSANVCRETNGNRVKIAPSVEMPKIGQCASNRIIKLVNYAQ